jgi:hypothetical protein
MTHLSEAIPSAGHNLGSIWGSFWDADRTQWQWQAPTPRPSDKEKSAAALPAWLLQWDITPQEKTVESVDAEGMDGRLVQEPARAEDDIRRFRETMRNTSGKHNIRRLSEEFAEQFKTSLALGLVSSETLHYALMHVSADIRQAFPNEKYTSYLCLAFYTSVWEGIAACKVLAPEDFDGKVMNDLVALLANLPVTQGMQALAQKILHSVSDNQLRHMGQGITSLVKMWTERWRDCVEVIRSAESLATEAEGKVANANAFAMALEEDSNNEGRLGIAQKAISGAYEAITMAIDATLEAEDIILPLQSSIDALARTLEKLPQKFLSALIPSWSAHMATGCREFRYRWITVVAQMPNVDDRVLVKTWRTVDRFNDFNTRMCSELLLMHWTSQGKVENPLVVRNTIAAYGSLALTGQCESFGRLLLALDTHNEMCFTRIGELFHLLYKLGRQKLIPEILHRMKEKGLKIPTSRLGAEVEKMSAYDIKQALNMYQLPSNMKLGRPFRLDFIPKFIIAQVNDPNVPPAAIWELLRRAIYKGSLRPQANFAKPLPPAMIDLLHKMAFSFARSEARRPRVAFRNVCRCLRLLRRHNAPISPDLTRALSHASITRSILDGLFVGQERLRYSLDKIAKVEGEDVAKEVDAVVYQWRQQFKDERGKERREGNVLGVGPIG